MTCKYCIHYGICDRQSYIDGVNESCDCFKDVNRIVELPCKVGDKVYWLGYFFEEEQKIHNGIVMSIDVHKKKDGVETKLFLKIVTDKGATRGSCNVDATFGGNVFFDRESAEKRKELEDSFWREVEECENE